MAESVYEPKYGALMDGEYYIQVNLPDSEASERTHNGEGCWVKVDEDVCRKYDEDYRGGPFTGTLANDSVYYLGLGCGDEVPFEMNGEYRPTVPFEWLVDNYGPCLR